MKPLQITSFTLTTALGAGLEANWQKITESVSGLSPCNFLGSTDLNTWVGEVTGLDQLAFDSQWQDLDCRNNRLALMALQQDNFIQNVRQAIDKYGASRIGIFLGTSTSGILQTEKAYLATDVDNDTLPSWYHYQYTHNVYSVVDFTRRVLGVEGPSAVISTACSSSAKVFASAHRMIECGLCDAVVVGGVDSLCLTTLYGFNSLQLISQEVCKPFDVNRSGISIGEAAGYALLERRDEAEFSLLGYGESSDAYHMSSPHPEGDGAFSAMQTALRCADLTPDQIAYINLHGTGTSANDLAESRAICRLFGKKTPCGSTKGWTGHTLGAAGIVELVLSLLIMRHRFMPRNLNTQKIDPRVESNILLDHAAATSRFVVTNSFGFGGSNCSLALGINT